MPSTNLDHHRATLKHLVTLIEDERAAIEISDTRRIDELRAAKSSALRDLSGLLEQIQGGRSNLREADRQELSQLLKKCMDANLANGTLINARTARVQSRLAPLMDDSPTYGPRKAFNGTFSQRLFARV